MIFGHSTLDERGGFVSEAGWQIGAQSAIEVLFHQPVSNRGARGKFVRPGQGFSLQVGIRDYTVHDAQFFAARSVDPGRAEEH